MRAFTEEAMTRPPFEEPTPEIERPDQSGIKLVGRSHRLRF
jgi:hypothetical protein